MAGEIGSLLTNTRGFLADTLGRFSEVAQKREQERSDPVRLGTYIGGQLDPMGRLGQIRGGLPGGTMWGTGAMGTIPSLDYLSQHGTPFRNPFAAQSQSGFAEPGQNTGPGSYPLPGPSPYQGGSSQAATSADNTKLTGQQINDWIARTRGNSPIAGMGDYILQVANQYGVSAPLMLGIFLKESELGVTAGSGKILSGITDPSRDQGLGGQRAFQGFATWQDAIAATAANLATGIYKGKSINEQIGNWYVGPQAYAQGGLGATDKAGNGTVGDYVNLVAGVYNALGVPFNGAAAPQYNQPRANVSLSSDGFAFPVAGYSQASVPLHWGSEHGGADLFAAEGTPVLSLGPGTVINAGSNSLGGNTVTIKLDNGLVVYMAHMRDPALVQAGQRVNAGQQLGFVGQTGNAQGTGAHLHIGIGQDIISGGGPTGGLGSNFDATAWLQAILNQTRAATGGGQQSY